MTKKDRQQRLHRKLDYGGHVYSDMELRKVFFDNCGLSITSDPTKRTIVRRLKLVDCTVMSCHPNTAIIEDVVVENLETYNVLQGFGTAFKHVTLRGKIGQLMLAPYVGDTEEEEAAMAKANAEYYQKVDWALDIREAEFDDLDLRGVPARLVRIDPGRQIVVTRQKAQTVRWKPRTEAEKYWRDIIEIGFETCPAIPDQVLAIPREEKRYREFLDAIRHLRDLGVAEPE